MDGRKEKKLPVSVDKRAIRAAAVVALSLLVLFGVAGCGSEPSPVSGALCQEITVSSLSPEASVLPKPTEVPFPQVAPVFVTKEGHLVGKYTTEAIVGRPRVQIVGSEYGMPNLAAERSQLTRNISRMASASKMLTEIGLPSQQIVLNVSFDDSGTLTFDSTDLTSFSDQGAVFDMILRSNATDERLKHELLHVGTWAKVGFNWGELFTGLQMPPEGFVEATIALDAADHGKPVSGRFVGDTLEIPGNLSHVSFPPVYSSPDNPSLSVTQTSAASLEYTQMLYLAWGKQYEELFHKAGITTAKGAVDSLGSAASLHKEWRGALSWPVSFARGLGVGEDEITRLLATRTNRGPKVGTFIDSGVLNVLTFNVVEPSIGGWAPVKTDGDEITVFSDNGSCMTAKVSVPGSARFSLRTFGVDDQLHGVREIVTSARFPEVIVTDRITVSH